jgi:cytochrome c553
VFAADEVGPGDAARGRVVGYTCLGCHGVDTYNNAYPTYSVPKLRGQHHEYIVAALKGYRDGERPHPTMHAQAASMSEQDMVDVAVFLGGQMVTAAPTAEPIGPRPAKELTDVCLACHGPVGVGIAETFPTLAGQHADYLEHALNDYVSGARKNAIMGVTIAPLNLNPQQVKELARFFSRQKPALQTVPKNERR